MKFITADNINALSLGAALLGSGGGGDTDILAPLVVKQLADSGPVTLLSVAELPPNAVIIPVAFVGSPAVTKARGADIKMFTNLYEKIKTDYPDNSLILMSAEIGGCNALTSFLLAASLSVPVLDADLIGRAFPKVNMCKPAINGEGQPITAYLSNASGQYERIISSSAAELEAKARFSAIESGGSTLIAAFIFPKLDVDKMAIIGSVSRALSLQNNDAKIKRHFKGIITNITNKNENGFLIGIATIQTSDSLYKIYFQNEFLCIKRNNDVLIKSPTIIAVLQAGTHIPIAAESLSLQKEVEIITIDPPAFWLTLHAASVVDLNQFELSEDES